jgi:hypothetical protein
MLPISVLPRVVLSDQLTLTEGRAMTTHSKRTTRIAHSLAAGGLLVLTTAIPAAAGQTPDVLLPDPVGNRALSVRQTPALVQPDDGFGYPELGLGVLAGLTLAGAGAVVMRTRHEHGAVTA